MTNGVFNKVFAAPSIQLQKEEGREITSAGLNIPRYVEV